MELNFRCDICGNSLEVIGFSPVEAELVMSNWSQHHQHSHVELQLYHATAAELEKFRHTHPFGESSDEDG